VRPATEALGAWIGGFVAAEGCFMHAVLPTKERFTFQVALGSVDGAVCEDMRNVFEVGRVVTHQRRRPHYDDEVVFIVTRLRDLIGVVVPFMDEHLPESHKRHQYEVWRDHLLPYWEHEARRRRPCHVADCTALALAHGLCRRHLWTETKR
jgi:hypothetical protein